jgi:hypothetical protein
MRYISRLTWVARSWLLVAALVGLVMAASAPAGAQTTPPVNGTVALEGTMKKFYRAANTIVVTTVDGVEHVYRFAKDLVVHGGKGSGVDALEGLREGSTVVIHYTPDAAGEAASEVDIVGAEGLEIAEGTVTRLDRGRKQITVRYDNGKTETFRLTDRAAAESETREAPGEDKVLIYYSTDKGAKVAHYFKKVTKT